MKFTSIPDGFPPNHRRPLLIPALSIVLSMSIGLQALHAQTTGSNNVPPKKDIYELQKITATPKGDKPLPIKLETYLKWLKKVNGEPESAPVDSDIQWTADKGEPIFDPSYGASVELDFGKPFVKENTAEAKKVTVTAAYTGSACVEKSPRTKDVERIYLDFWIAETEDSEDDVLIVRDENAQPAADDKKVIHWAKVLVKHSAPSVLPLQLESTGEKKLYFYGEQQNPNQLPEDPPLEETLEKEYADGEWFWIGTEEKGTGQGKFKAQADPGTGFKDAPEEKTVNLLPVEVISDLNNDGEITSADNPLRDAALESGATDEEKDKGTEFLFVNDQLSNGLWDGEDSDPDKPADEKDDDDAQEIKINPGITEGEVWLEHPAITGLSFYKTRECKEADKVNLSHDSRFSVSSENPFPDKLYVRADGDFEDAQIEGDLILKIKVGGENAQEIEALKMKFTLVKKLGA